MSIFRGQHGFGYAHSDTDSARGFLEVCIALRMLGLRAGAGSSGSDDTMGKSVHHNSRETVIMQRVLHLKTTVQPGGKVEFVSPELEAGQMVDVVVLHESGGRGRSIMEILNSGPECRLFQTAEEVKAYLAEEKASWDR